jgi:hypothetical protein
MFGWVDVARNNLGCMRVDSLRRCGGMVAESGACSVGSKESFSENSASSGSSSGSDDGTAVPMWSDGITVSGFDFHHASELPVLSRLASVGRRGCLVMSGSLNNALIFDKTSGSMPNGMPWEICVPLLIVVELCGRDR